MNDLLIGILGSDIPIVRDVWDENLYGLRPEKWIAWNYSNVTGANYSDDAPRSEEKAIQIHLYVPLTFNYETVVKDMKTKLLNGGFSYPQMVAQYEKEDGIRHITLSTIFSEMED